MNDRNQSIELLRIVLMTLILFGHLLGFGIDVPNNNQTISIYKIIQPLYLFHVDAFVFISGYYGMNLKWEKFSVLLIKMIFYSFIACGGYFILTNSFSSSFLIKNIYPLSACDWWFMAQYLFLMLLVPFLNVGLEKMDRRQSRLLIVVLYIASFRIFNCLLIFIYLLGRHLKRYPIKKIESNALIIFIVTLFVFFIFNIGCRCYSIYPKKMYEYMSPFNIIAAVSIFYVFKNFSISWKGISYISSGVLAAYLITTHGIMQIPFNQWLVSLVGTNLFMCLFASFGVVICCSLVDRVISPLANCIQKKCLYLLHESKN